MKDLEVYKELGKRLRLLRKGCGKSQTELANELGFTQAMLTSYETGNKRMSLENLITIAEYFGMTLDELIGEDIFKQRSNKDKQYLAENDMDDLCVVSNALLDYIEDLHKFKWDGKEMDDDSLTVFYNGLVGLQRTIERMNPRQLLDQTLFELKEKKYDIFEEQTEKQTYVRLKGEKNR